MFGTGSGSTIVFLDRNKLLFHGGNIPASLSMDIPVNFVSDLEVLDRDGLYTFVNQWLKQNQIGAELYMILSANSYYDQAITGTTESGQETEILKFYDMVPFDDLLTKIITIDGAKRVFAMNKAYIDAIRNAFSLQGRRVMLIIPIGVLGQFAKSRWMDAAMGDYVQKHVAELRKYNVLDGPVKESYILPDAKGAAEPKTNPRLMVMVGVFGLLLLILVFLIFVRPS